MKVPGVPDVAGWAPGSTMQPPALECLAATAAAIVELHTDCFHIMSQFCTMKLLCCYLLTGELVIVSDIAHLNEFSG